MKNVLNVAFDARINDDDTATQSLPAVSVGPTGQGAAVWVVDGTLSEVWCRVINVSGPVGYQFQVDVDALRPSVSHSPSGSFLVTWDDESDVYAQRFSASGVSQGDAFKINSGAYTWVADSEVAVNPGGAYVVSFDTGQASAARLFDSLDNPLAPDFVDVFHEPDAALDILGNSVVVNLGPDFGVRFQRYDANTDPVGSHPQGATPESVFDLAGNVAEWTASLMRPYPYVAGGVLTPVAGERVTRGGDHVYDVEAIKLTATFRDGFSRNPLSGHKHIGFRCARSEPRS